MTYFISGSFNDDRSIYNAPGNYWYKRYTLRGNFTFKLAQDLSMDYQTSFRATSSADPANDDVYNEKSNMIFNYIAYSDRLTPATVKDNPNHYTYQGLSPTENVMAMMNHDLNYTDKRGRAFTNTVNLTYTPHQIKGLRLMLQGAYDFNYDGDTEDANEQDYSNSSGSVTRFTEVNVMGGTVHRNVYGGGSMGSVGAPNMGQTYELYKPGQADIVGKPENGPGRQSMNTVNIGGGTSVVTIGTPFDAEKGWTYNKVYGGEVYGACRGLSTLDPDQFANSVWTKVNIKDKATIMGNVYGGGDSGIVKKDSEVKIGE